MVGDALKESAAAATDPLMAVMGAAAASA